MLDCAFCPTGKFEGASGASTCTVCGAGKLATQEGSLSCQLCPRYVISEKQRIRERAARSRHTHERRRSHARVHTRSRAHTLAHLHSHTSGSYNADDGTTAALHDEAAVDCTPCPAGKMSTELRIGCDSCVIPLTSSEGAATCGALNNYNNSYSHAIQQPRSGVSAVVRVKVWLGERISERV